MNYDAIPADDSNDLLANEEPRSFLLERHLSLMDLIAVGISGTVGSGIFVLSGLVASQYAGPAAVLSWMISGVTALLSACCYAELSGRIPLAGGAYAYNYVAMGEIFAVLTAACLSIEYIAAAAAVSRSWGDKCILWLTEELTTSRWIITYLDGSATFNPLALVLSAGTVVLLLCGVKESKAATNFFTVLKIIVVSVMVFGAMRYVQPSNWTPFAPYGVGGIVRGATGTFFGYLGYDQITALAGEAKNAKRNLPLALMCEIVFVMTLYCAANWFLTGMQPYHEISAVSAFPDAFRSVGANMLAEFVSIGEIVTLPIVVLVTIMAQPRLQYALAVDGLLPPIFSEIDEHGNLWKGTLISGGIMTLVSAFVPFENLNDMISCAVLLVLSLTDTSVVLLWHEGPSSRPSLPFHLMSVFHFLSLVASLVIAKFADSFLGKTIAVLLLCAVAFTCFAVYRWCPRAAVFGGHRPHYHEQELHKEEGYFATPFVPLLPCVAVFVNWYLMVQLELLGAVLLLVCLALSVVYYFSYGGHHSVGNKGGWETTSTHEREVELEGNDAIIDRVTLDH
ncbi:hypothetical protein ACA910_016928 [Epithemia clementina (nom. ined.)]